MTEMDAKTTKRLVASGWRVGDAKDFLELSDDEAGFIELKLALAQDLRTRRLARGLNQTQVANLVGSSQSRVAKMEAADASVSIDLLIRSLLKLGAARQDLAKVVSRGPTAAAT
jgi:predicted XRE-type DNA-binding protein